MIVSLNSGRGVTEMANYAKYTKGAMGHLTKHYERAKGEDGQYIKFGNQDIDASKTHLNYNLAPDHDQLDFIHRRLDDVYCMKRKDVNVMCSWIVTAPQDLNPGQEKAFLQESYKFLQEKYGQKNVISSYVHMDEKTPHMHFSFIPVVADRKHKQGEKVSAKECVTKTDLQQFHEQLQQYLTERGISCSVINKATLQGNKSIEELKRGTARQTLQNVHKATKKEKDELNNLLKQKNALEREIRALKNMKNIQGQVLSSQQIKNIKTENIMLDSEKVKISKIDLASLQKSALLGEQAEKIYDASKTCLQKAELILKQAEQKQKEPVKEKMERLELKKKVESYNKALKQCPEDVLKTFNRALKSVERKNEEIVQKKMTEHNL